MKNLSKKVVFKAKYNSIYVKNISMLFDVKCKISSEQIICEIQMFLARQVHSVHLVSGIENIKKVNVLSLV